MTATAALQKPFVERETFPLITVVGKRTWEECFDETVELSSTWANVLGDGEVPFLEFLKKKAELEEKNFARCIVHEFLRRRYTLEALEVEFSGPIGRDWGRAIWYKQHPFYKRPFESDAFGKPKDKRIVPEFWHAMFKTEREEEDQHFCIYSIEMLESPETLFHRTMVYHKIRFSPPRQRLKSRRIKT